MDKKRLIQILFVIAVTVVFILYIKKNYPQLRQALNIRADYLIILVLLNLCNKVFTGFKMKKILEVFKVRLSFCEWFGLSMVNNFYNYLAPKGGTAISGIYLKNKHKLNFHKYISLLLASGIFTILTLGVCGLLVSSYVYFRHAISSPFLFFIFGALSLGPVVLLSMPKFRFRGEGIFIKVNEALEGWHLLRRNKKLIFVSSSMDAGLLLVTGLRYYVIFKIFSLNATLASCLIISPFNIIMHFATLVPGGYGVKEAAVGLAARLTNIGFAQGVFATLTDRVIFMALSFIMGPIFSLVLFRHVLSRKEIAVNE